MPGPRPVRVEAAHDYLLTRVNETVPLPDLIRAVYGAKPPATAHNAMDNILTRVQARVLWPYTLERSVLGSGAAFARLRKRASASLPVRHYGNLQPRYGR